MKKPASAGFFMPTILCLSAFQCGSGLAREEAIKFNIIIA
jgi:hypothetical protein